MKVAFLPKIKKNVLTFSTFVLYIYISESTDFSQLLVECGSTVAIEYTNANQAN